MRWEPQRTVIGRFFNKKKGLSAVDPADRLKAIKAIADGDRQSLQPQLVELARTDPDKQVRNACVALIENTDTLIEFLDTPAVAQRAAENLLQQNRTQNTPLPAHSRILNAQLAAAQNSLQHHDILVKVTDMALLVEVGLTDTNLWAVISNLISIKNEAALQHLEKSSRGRNKKINRFARDNLEALKAAKEVEQRILTRADELLNAWHKNVSGEHNQAFFTKQNALADLFTQLCNDHRESAEVLSGFNIEPASIQRHSAAFDQRIPHPQELPEEETTVDTPANFVASSAPEKQTSESAFAELTNEIAAINNKLNETIDLQAVITAGAELKKNWLIQCDQVLATETQTESFQAFTNVLKRLEQTAHNLEKLAGDQENTNLLEINLSHADIPTRALLRQANKALKQLDWPDWLAPSQLLVALTDKQTELAALVKKQHQAEAKLVEQLAQTCTELNTAIDNGALHGANGAAQQLRKQQDQLTIPIHKTLRSEINQAFARLKELQDWQAFATTDKRSELCDRINELAQSPLAPADQAARIKHLRQQWNELGPLTQAQDYRANQQFNQSAETAFEHCRGFFEAQAAERQQNFQQREQICAQLKQYLDTNQWHDFDIKSTQQIMQTARSQWRTFYPIDRSKEKVQTQAFENLLEQIHTHVKSAWESNIQSKTTLVAAALLITEDTEQTPEAKSAKLIDLQKQWKQVGQTPRSKDQALWQQFRTHCDTVFNARSEHRAQSKQAEQTLIGQANTSVQEIQALVSSSDAQSVSADGLKHLRAQARALETDLASAPSNTKRSAGERVEQAIADYRQLLDKQSQAAAIEQLNLLQALDLQLTDRDSKAITNPASTLDKKFRNLCQGIIDCRAAAESEATSSTDTESIDRLRKITVSTEYKAGIESPVADQALRLELQVNQLSKSLGGNTSTPTKATSTNASVKNESEAQSRLSQAIAWCEIPKTPSADIAELRQRFFVALSQHP